MSHGIYIAKDGKQVGKKRNRFDTDVPHYQINLLKSPKHMDVFDIVAGTALNTATIEDETLLTIDHNLGYTPEVMAYFYVVSYDGSTTHDNAGRYGPQMLLMSGSIGAFSDALFFEVNDKQIKLKHELEIYIGGAQTSEAPKFFVRIKYYIFSRPARVSEYNTKWFS